MSMNRTFGVGLAALALGLSLTPAGAKPPVGYPHGPVAASAGLPTADLATLGKALKAAHGKVALVNFWASW